MNMHGHKSETDGWPLLNDCEWWTPADIGPIFGLTDRAVRQRGPAGPRNRIFTDHLPAQEKRAIWNVRLVVLVFWLSALVMALVLSLVHIARLDAASRERAMLLQTRLMITDAKDALNKMEIGNRGFMMTGREEMRGSFTLRRDTFSYCWNELGKMTADDPTQQERLREVKAKLTQWFDVYVPLVQKRRREAQLHGDQVYGEHAYQINSTDQTALLRCNMLFDDIQFMLDEISTAEVKGYYAGG